MAEAVVSLALETLRDVLLEEGRLLVGVGGEVKALQTQLREIKCLLADAGGKQHQSESVRNWIAEIRDLAYRSEDVAAAYASSFGRRRRRLLILNCYPLHQLGHETSEIKSELARVMKSMEGYGIRRIIDGSEISAEDESWERKTFSDFQIGDCFVGKEEELKQLLSLLVDDEERRVISVWGMGGIGKTTIARKVYNQLKQKQNRNYDSFAWVCITQQCRIRSVLEGVLKQLVPEKGEGVSSLSEEQLIEQLCEVQRAKRCLIVLDDLWETSHWNGFRHAFLARDSKSKILVTTRKYMVAEIGFSLELGLLDKDDAWELLKKKSGGIPDFGTEEEVHKIGKEMVRKCGYLPLAISLLAGVLSKKNSVREWEAVNENIDASIYSDEEKCAEIDGVLNLSYQDLPFHLKSCFLYLGRLREDESIYVVDLYRMWTALGMVSNENFQGKKETLMDIAELYLTELASRCMVQVEVEDAIPSQKYKTCKLHDVVRELCLKVGGKEDFGVQSLEYQAGNFTTLLRNALSSMKTRHLAVHVDRALQQQERDELTITLDEDTGKHLRSFQMFNNIHRETIEFPPKSVIDFQKFKMLKGLVIVRFKFPERKLPRGITKLVHLKYLRLQECELDRLPLSIRNLANLDTLDLTDSWNVRLPNVLKRMFRLKHLLLPCYDKKAIGKYRLTLDVGDELESLITFDTSVHELKSIARMKNLRRFSASIHSNESLSSIINAVATNCTKLLYWAVSIKHGCQLTASEQGRTNLKQVFTCPNLYYLGIYVPLGKLVAECRSDVISSKLVRLVLLECEIEDDPMEILGELRCLRDLYLYSRSFVGEKMTCPAFSFPRMKTLFLDRLPNLREWRVEEGAMPLVSEIHITNCPRLEKVPDGFSRVSTLQKLAILGMPELGRRVLATGDDFHKVRHVPSIIIDC